MPEGSGINHNEPAGCAVPAKKKATARETVAKVITE
jgi:hypothetical protein